MKKRHIIIPMLAFIFMAFAFCFRLQNLKRLVIMPSLEQHTSIQNRNNSPESKEQDIINILPASLQLIDDEAFEGTSLRGVELPASVTKIGDRVFADNKDLLLVRLPENLHSLGDNVFTGSEHAVMAVYADSAALDLAQRKGYRYQVVLVFRIKQDTGEPSALLTGLSVQIKEGLQKNGICSAGTKARRTGRTSAELKGEMYRGVASLYVRSRYFP